MTDPGLTTPHIGNRIIRGLLAYFERRQGHGFVDEVLAESGLPRSYFDDLGAWVSVEWAARFTAAVAARLAGSREPAMDDLFWQHWVDAGRDSITPAALGPAWHLLRALGSPRWVYGSLPGLISRANAVTEVSVEHLGRGQIRVVAKPRADRDLPYACWSRVGFFDAIPTIWGLPRATVEHPRCIHRHGAEQCEYVLRYRDATPWALGLVAPSLLGGALGAVLGGEIHPLPGALAGASTALAGVLGWQRSRAAARERDAAAGFDDVLAASDARYRALWEEREALRRSLLANRKISGYLAHDLVERILADPEVELSLGGTRVEAAVLFADLVGFTPRCEAMAPERVVSDLNVYFRHVDGVIDAHGGIIDKRIGDAVMVVFVVRNGDVAATHARAVACARAILGAVGPCNEELARAGSPPLQVRVGVAAGPLVQGNMGSSVRLEYTVIGDTVNLAARLEGLATPGRALVLASMVEGEAGERRTVNVKGKVQAVEVVEVWGFA